eukprot:4042008-Alexandrium_andersonii.AAC.1
MSGTSRWGCWSARPTACRTSSTPRSRTSSRRAPPPSPRARAARRAVCVCERALRARSGSAALHGAATVSLPFLRTAARAVLSKSRPRQRRS